VSWFVHVSFDQELRTRLPSDFRFYGYSSAYLEIYLNAMAKRDGKQNDNWNLNDSDDGV
jgi:hypothetical protein